MKRVAATGLALLLAGCSSSSGNSAYGQFYKMAQLSFASALGNVRVTREQAAAIPYASIGYSEDGGNQSMLVLATDSGGDQLWTAATHVVLVTHDGRIVRSVGLGKDLAGSTSRGDLPAPAAALQGPFTTTTLRDYPDIGLYGVTVTCRSSARGRQTIRILDQPIATVRVDEACTSKTPNWSFVNSYWVSANTGTVWRARQTIHPKGGIIETEILRPPG